MVTVTTRSYLQIEGTINSTEIKYEGYRRDKGGKDESKVRTDDEIGNWYKRKEILGKIYSCV